MRSEKFRSARTWGHLAGVDEHRRVERPPHRHAIIGLEQQQILVAKPEIVESAKRAPAAVGSNELLADAANLAGAAEGGLQVERNGIAGPRVGCGDPAVKREPPVGAEHRELVSSFKVQPSEAEPVELLIVEQCVTDTVPSALVETLATAGWCLEIGESLVPPEARLGVQARRVNCREAILHARVLCRGAPSKIWP